MRTSTALGIISQSDIEMELQSRGVYPKAPEYPAELPSYTETPYYPVAPESPVVVVPPGGDSMPVIIEPYMPAITPERQPWEIVLPAQPAEKAGIDRNIIYAGAAGLGLLILLSFRGQAPQVTRRRVPSRSRTPRKRTITEEFTPIEAEYEEVYDEV
jgi:hypothetical protein